MGPNRLSPPRCVPLAHYWHAILHRRVRAVNRNPHRDGRGGDGAGQARRKHVRGIRCCFRLRVLTTPQVRHPLRLQLSHPADVAHARPEDGAVHEAAAEGDVYLPGERASREVMS